MAHLPTLSGMVTEVRDSLDESSASFWTDAQLERYINRAKDRVYQRVRALNADYFTVSRTSNDGTLTILGESYAASSFAIAIDDTTRDYTLPPDFVEMKQIEVITSNYEDIRFVHRDLNHPEMRALLSITAGQTPSEFVYDLIGERTMRVAPFSNTALALRLTYMRMFADLTTDADTLEMPHPLYLAVEDYATFFALRQDRSPDAVLYEKTADKLVAEFSGGHHRQIQDGESAVAYLAEYTGWQ